MKTLCLIPARGTSTRLHRKNLREVGGVPLVRRAVDIALAAQHAGLVEEVFVSTDDHEIEELIRLTVRPYWRGRTLDAASSVRDVVVEFLNNLDGERWELVLILLPTSPLRTLRTVVQAYRLMAEHGFAHPVMTAVRARKTPKHMLIQAVDGLWSVPFPDAGGEWWAHEGGAIWTKPEWLREDKGFYDRPCLIQEVPPEEAVDVDTELDLAIAEAIHKSQIR